MLLKGLKEYYKVSDLKEALALLRREEGSLIPLAGATSRLIRTQRKIDGAMDLTFLPLKYVQEADDYLETGALTTITELMESPLAGEWTDGMLRKACSSLASTPLRNVITIGGNTAGLFRWSDTPAALLVMDAEFQIDGEGSRWIKAVDWFSEHPRKRLGHEHLLTRIRFPKNRKKCKGAFVKYARSTFDYNFFDIAAAMNLDDGNCRDVRIAVSGISALPERLTETEKMLEGKKLTETLIDEAAAKGLETVKPIADIRVSKEWKLEASEAILKRVLQEKFYNEPEKSGE